MSVFYTYVLKNSLDGQPFYVGKGSKRRMYQHKQDATNPNYLTFRSVHRKIQSILAKGGELIYEVYELENEDEAFKHEILLILEYGRKDIGTGILCNLTAGGEGSSGRSIELIEKMRAMHVGAKRSDQSKAFMRQRQLEMAEERRKIYGHGVSDEARKNMSDSRKGKGWTDNARAAVREKPTAKAVLMFQKDSNEFAGEFESISLCARAIGGDATTIWKILELKPVRAGKNKTCLLKSHKGYTFKYKEA